MEVLEHRHPLTLIDLQVQYEEEDKEDNEEEKEDDFGDPTMKEGFHGVKCKMCREEIHMYQRYYYKCMDMECDFSLHKFCVDLPERLDHTLHLHPLIRQRVIFDWTCRICQSSHKPGKLCYSCDDCYFCIDVKCVVEVGKRMIHHPCHPHSLICVTTKPILCECGACGKEHKGIFYQCTTCVGFSIHSDCAFLPKTLLIQQTTDNAFHHTHPLTILYSFNYGDQKANYFPRCRVCGQSFYDMFDLWLYKCDKCMYYAHLDCATSRREPFMSIFLPAGLMKNYKDADHPQLLHLPFPDETHSIPKRLFFQETDYNINLTHASHQHPLILVDLRNSNEQTSSKNTDSLLLMCHDPMKKTQLLCNGCLRPITSTIPFYKCAETCNFTLHEWCTRLPPKIEHHPAHSHPLDLMYSNIPGSFFGVFNCAVCRLPCNGFVYCCVRCGYYVDVTCGFIPKQITHKSHPNHLLSLVQKESVNEFCHMCLRHVWLKYPQLFYNCNSCNIFIHPECALLLPEVIRHKYDKHPMHLSYLPIENHKSKYFCEICEEDLNPHACFYHCHGCVQSIHTACAPLILQSETETYTCYKRSIYYFVNIKFGDEQLHGLSFAQGVGSDGTCIMCHRGLQCKMVFKSLEFKFAICYDCCKRYTV